jgi:hypothetical protein
MKAYAHAWLAFKAIERLEHAKLAESNKKFAESLKDWFHNHRDGVIKGAWYPDEIIKDNKTSHILKITPDDKAKNKFKSMPNTYLSYKFGKKSSLFKKSFVIDKTTNLPDRCESIAQAVIDNLKMQEKEQKGSPVSPTDNHVATLMFMLSHYIADAHVPFHCDSRSLSDGCDLHGYVEKLWDEEIKKYYLVDENNKRFIYNPSGYPLLNDEEKTNHNNSFLKKVEDNIKKRKFLISWGNNNNNVWDFMSAVCQYSYLMSYGLVPQGNDEKNVTLDNWQNLPGKTISYEELSISVLTDAIDSIARIWLRVWRKYMKWEKGQRKKKKD